MITTAMLPSLILISLLLTLAITHNILLEYSFSFQNKDLHQYFHNLPNNHNFYVDIGAHDPVFLSNSIQLYVDGWTGLNVDANPNFLRTFSAIRKNQVFLNMAIGDSNQFVRFYRMTNDAMSTVSEQVREMVVKQYNQTSMEMLMPSISMQTLCYNYFWQRPTFLNIDTVGYGSKALSSNNWNLQKCRPQLIMSEFMQFNQASGLQTPQSILTKNNYTLLLKSGPKQLFVSTELFDRYREHAAITNKSLGNMTIIKTEVLNKKIKERFKVDDIFGRNFDPINSPMYIYYARRGQPIYLQQILDIMHSYSPLTKPILLLQHHLTSPIILQKSSKYSLQKIDLGDHIVFTQINITTTTNNININNNDNNNNNEDRYEILVFDQYQDGRIVDVIVEGEGWVEGMVVVGVLGVIVGMAVMGVWLWRTKKEMGKLVQEKSETALETI